MYGLEQPNDDEYIVHLPDGATLRVPITDDGKLAEEMTRIDETQQRNLTYLDLSTDLRSFIRSSTGLEFENQSDT